MTEQKTALDFEVLRRADEQNDVELLASFYADDAEAYLISKDNPLSSPYELRGKEEIAEYLRDVCGREMKHNIEREVVGEDRIAFNKVCKYPDGTRVLAADAGGEGRQDLSPGDRRGLGRVVGQSSTRR